MPRRDLTISRRLGELDNAIMAGETAEQKEVLALICPDCGKIGLDYLGFVLCGKTYYRAFAICGRCGYEEEMPEKQTASSPEPAA